MIDPLPLAQALIRRASVTPEDAGAQGLLAQHLESAGFTVTHLPFANISNLYAERGGDGPHLGFAGHTDVVPPGPPWRHDPFGGEVENGLLYGRGACDMKGAIAAFLAAAANANITRGKISLLITGDEEGEALNGTTKVLDWMAQRSKIPDFALVGEPTSRATLGDVIKIGRRGSLSATITVTGRQGHVAYPHLADNPLHRLIPAQDTALLNIRFNNLHSQASLSDWLTEILAAHAADADLKISCSGEAFLTQPGPATTLLTAAISQITGITPAQETSGGTSDARFIARHCPVAEFGLVGATMHHADECLPVSELRQLATIYQTFIERFSA